MQYKILLMFVLCMPAAIQKQTKRNILIFANKANNANVAKQVNILKADVKGVNDRDIIYKIISYSPASLAEYKKWGITNLPFTVILIGKDNGEKMRSHNPITLTKLFDVIDNMPMRKQEVQNKTNR